MYLRSVKTQTYIENGESALQALQAFKTLQAIGETGEISCVLLPWGFWLYPSMKSGFLELTHLIPVLHFTKKQAI